MQCPAAHKTCARSGRGPLPILLSLLLLLSGTVCYANGCPIGDWTYSESSLQKARGRIKSTAHKSVSSRIQCGLAIDEAFDGAAVFPKECSACVREYVGFLLDMTQYERLAAEQTASAKSRSDYYESEIRTRRKLAEFLRALPQEDWTRATWTRNFEGLGDAMERMHDGHDYHVAATLAADRDMSVKTFETWARAIRSCDEWDFVQGQNRDLPALKEALLCVDECKLALTRILDRSRIGAVDGPNIDLALSALLPANEDCPIHPASN
ncbi:hypothetical protein SAMN05216289_11368 [Dokdonella immobilis]|uniref:Uncharacterized protein n=1 Tax=Dokdonella immobilis TaxID=578942 RepID=A0A1I4Y136_9GAMM|nr:hypothetical protein SAMN05216289_11368 [Dokdonella immobilis]